jgi:hypothetical protein
MIDLLKLGTYNTAQIDYLFNHKLLAWHSDTDKINIFDKEVINTKKIKQYKGIYFCFYSSKLDVLFKPHYYFNDNVHNANDFKIKDCIAIINEVKNALNLDLEVFKVVNIEYGLNVLSPIDIKDLITYFAYHLKNEFRTDTGLAYSKKSYSVTTTGTANEYKIIKAYAKGIQFPLYSDINTFRFEVKSKRSRFINKLGVYNATDLLNENVYFAMVKSLIIEFEDTLILDCETNFKTLTQKEQTKISKFNNPMEWYKIKNSTNRNSFSKNKTEYNRLINKIPNNLKLQLRQIIFDKLELLKEGAISQPQNKIKKGALSQLYNRGICTQNNTQTNNVKTLLCKVTGLNISMQKNNSLLLSHKGLKYYFKTDQKVFEQIKRQYLSNRWSSSDFETQIKEIAHNIRNAKSNQGIKQERIYPIQQVNFLNQFSFFPKHNIL